MGGARRLIKRLLPSFKPDMESLSSWGQLLPVTRQQGGIKGRTCQSRESRSSEAPDSVKADSVPAILFNVYLHIFYLAAQDL